MKKNKELKFNCDKQIDLSKYHLQNSISSNLLIFDEILKNDDTLRKRHFENQDDNAVQCCALFLDGMANTILINENIVKPIVSNKLLFISNELLDTLQSQVLFSNDVKKSNDVKEIIDAIQYGDTILLVEGSDNVLIINSKGWQTRSISEPESEKTIRGSHEGFTESILINISLIRRRLKTSDLKVQFKTFGDRTNTKGCICYLDSVIDKGILKELEKRLDKMHFDGVVDTNFITEAIKDSKMSIFKTVDNSERPDTVAAKLLEGRIAIMLDGCPQVLIIPYLFVENFQSSDDYYINFYYSSINRLLRFVAFFVTISLPAIYLALVSYHREMIPTSLALSIAEAQQGIPFPPIVECIIMLTIFELLREAGTRIPSYVGQSLSIVGALVIGQAAVEAKIISAPVVIIVALTAITGLMSLKLQGATLIIRTGFILMGSFIGLFGYFFGVLGLLIHLLGLRSFGVNYTANMIPSNLNQAKDSYIRSPSWLMKNKPKPKDNKLSNN